MRTLLLSSLLLAARPAFAAPAPADAVEVAQERFQAGRQLYKDGRFADALAAFRQAQAQVDSPNVRLYLGRCLVALGRVLEGYDELVGAQREAAMLKAQDAKYAATESAASEEARALLPRIGQLHVTLLGAPENATVRVAGRPVPTSELGEPVRVVPGPVPVEVDAPGYARITQTLVVSGGQTQEVRIELHRLTADAPLAAAAQPEPRVETRTPTWATAGTWTGAGLAAAGAIGFGGFYLAADAQHRKLVEQCVQRGCPAAQSDDLRQHGRDLERWTNISLAVAGVGATVGIASFVLGRALPETSRVAVVPGTRGASLLASF